jgi:hypothetical protein
VKTLDMDCGFKKYRKLRGLNEKKRTLQEAQGSKREEKDLTAIIFELRVDCGLIPRKLRGSLTKWPG